MLHLETVFAPNLIWNGGFFKLQETPEVRKLTEKARGRQKWGSPGFSTGSWLGHCRSSLDNGRVQKWGIPRPWPFRMEKIQLSTIFYHGEFLGSLF